MLGLLEQGTKNRHIGETRMNRESSRSHCVLVATLRADRRRGGVHNTLTSRLNLVDLAGSEQQKASGAVGERLREASNINKSLSILGRVINSLAQQTRARGALHVPYRDSKLTFLLQVSPFQHLPSPTPPFHESLESAPARTLSRALYDVSCPYLHGLHACAMTAVYRMSCKCKSFTSHIMSTCAGRKVGQRALAACVGSV